MEQEQEQGREGATRRRAGAEQQQQLEKGQQPTVMSIQFLCFRARRQVLASFPDPFPRLFPDFSSLLTASPP